MITIKWYGVEINGAYAVNLQTDIIIYDDYFNKIQEIVNLTYRDWPHISIEGGTWTDPSEIPTETDRLQASIDYLDMQTESFEKSDEINRADIDYCLMMLDNGATE